MSTTFWPKQKVLVTGGTGFLGSYLCRRLVDVGSDVYATSRTECGQHGQGPRWFRADLADIGAARELLSEIRPDIIYHLAGSVTAVPSKEFVLPTFHSLLTSTVNLLAAVTETGCRRLILCGSLDEPQAHQGEVTPSSPYAAAKWAASGYGRMFQVLYGTPVVILRPYMTYGPGQDPRKLIPAVILALLNREAPRLSTGRWEADWIYIDDVIDGLLAAAQVPHVEGSTFDLGSGVLVSVREIVQQLGKLVGTDLEPIFGALPDRPFEQVRAADTAEAESKLGWKPLTPLNDGLMRTIEWYRMHMNAARL